MTFLITIFIIFTFIIIIIIIIFFLEAVLVMLVAAFVTDVAVVLAGVPVRCYCGLRGCLFMGTCKLSRIRAWGSHCMPVLSNLRTNSIANYFGKF